MKNLQFAAVNMRSIIFSFFIFLSCNVEKLDSELKSLVFNDIELEDYISTELKSFPTANGGGSNATGGRGYEVYHVTNLNNDGAGSLRQVLSDVKTNGGGNIVFDVSGTIEISSSVSIPSNCTIAGQTAPQPGISICGAPIYMDNVDNIIVRYIRQRLNLNNYSWGGSIDAWRGGNTSNIIIDHCSISWGADESLSFFQDSNDVTIQNCLLGEGKTASIFGDSSDPSRNSNLSYLRNAIYNTTHRTPNVNTDGRNDIINNIVFNWKYALSRVSGNILLNHIGNYYSMGALTGLWDDNGEGMTLRPETGTRIYTEANILDKEGTILITKDDDQWTDLWQEDGDPDFQADEQYRTLTKHSDMINPPAIIDTDVLVSTLMDDVGACRTLNADGTVNFEMDNVDEVYKANIVAGNAISYNSGSSKNDYNTTSHWSEFWSNVSNTPINTRPAGYDTDNDGMPDVWELAMFEDLTNDGKGDHDGDGYTNIEEYLNQIDN